MRTLPVMIAAASAAFLTTPLAAQQPGVPAPEAANTQAPITAPQSPAADVGNLSVNQIFIYGDDACPTSTDPEVINVCARLPPQDRYRIPPNLREDPNAPENQAWTNRAIELSYVGASGIGSCSPAGSGGFAGCNQQLINQAVAERRGRPEVNWARLIEEARQQRLGQIDRSSAEEEANAGGRTQRRVQELTIRAGQTCPPSTELVIIVCNERR